MAKRVMTIKTRAATKKPAVKRKIFGAKKALAKSAASVNGLPKPSTKPWGKAGKALDGFEVMAAVPVSLTSNRSAALESFRQTATRYASLPYYRKALDKCFDDMTDSPNDRILDELAGIGDEKVVQAAVERYREAGVTMPLIGHHGSHEGAAKFEDTLEAVAG